jgi:hypothetical protein
MTPCCWISVDYLRLGYDDVREKNPVVVLVTVEEGKVSEAEGQRIVDALSAECKKYVCLLHDLAPRRAKYTGLTDISLGPIYLMLT